MTVLPAARGALSDLVFDRLRSWSTDDLAKAPEPESPDDAAITLWALQQLAYLGFEDVDDATEWDPNVVAVRVRLEHELEHRLRERWPGPPDGVRLDEDFFDWVDAHDGLSLARHVQTHATESQVRALLRARSVYHLHEADPTAWTVPRLPAESKAALVELQYDEYGGGRPARLHAHLFARGLAASGIDAAPGSHADEAPLEVLDQDTAVTTFGLHRRLRGAALGHLAAFEATSSMPSRRMAQGLERLGFPAEMVEYYAEHVEADAVHEQLAVRTICASLVAAEPRLEPDVWFGAWTCLDLEDRTARRLLSEWGVAA